MVGSIFNIQRFSTGDGPGIRTVAFLKGCPLACTWCHNPESKSMGTDIFYDSTKCVNCRKCENICDNNQHILDLGKHLFLRDNCQKCAKCVEECPVGALQICGKEVSTDNVVAELLRDSDFFKESGGGITLSGGEPLAQYDFSLEILKKAKKSGIHTAIETSGYYHGNLNEISQYVDLWLYDIKLFPEDEHIEHTGVSNKIILGNLHYLDGIGAKIILRCPIIPDVNFSKAHFEKIAKLANSLKNVVSIHFEPYQPLGIDKAVRLGRTQVYKNKNFLHTDDILPLVEHIRSKTNAEIEIL